MLYSINKTSRSNFDVEEVMTASKVYYSNSSLLADQNKYLTKDCIYGHIANMAPICGADGCLKVHKQNMNKFKHVYTTDRNKHAYRSISE